MTRYFLIAVVFTSHFLSGADHMFRGRHFIASYLDCDLRSLSDLDGLMQAMDAAVRASGATVLDRLPYIFPPNGLTIVYLLSESHASLHTYPEHGACFVDLFTCGDHCCAEKFDEALRAYLQPQCIQAQLLLRDETIREIPLESVVRGVFTEPEFER
jgi:S-adenosylmethionine decarboxylase proenzyme